MGRTFPELQFFQSGQVGQQKLQRVLQALAIFKKKTPETHEEVLGYTQGMNFIAGTALVHLQQHEENTFWFMVALLVEHQFQ